MIRGLLCLLVAAVMAVAMLSQHAFAQQKRSDAAAAPEKIEIKSKPIDNFQSSDPSRKNFGSLEFRGGLELSSAHKEFGGLSAIRVSPDGASFLALSDNAHWLRGRIVYRDGRPTGITDAEIAPMLYSDGKPLRSRGWYDSESLAEDGGIVYVGLERVHRILRFDIGKQGLLARGTLVPTPPEMKSLPSNGGIECLLAGPKGSPLAGSLIAISERGRDDAGNLKGFLIGGPKPGLFSVKPSDDFDVTDCAITPAADLLILERHFSWRRGVALRIRRVPISSVVPGAVLDGPVILLADLGYQIDNMEGLSVHRAPNGEIILTLVSDDNFSIIQRTILLQFVLRD